MASGIFALFDDVASLMDDVAMMSKIATKKTAGILGDDLAVNAEKAMGFVSEREIPVIWAITKGSFLNKLIILPLVFLLKAIYSPAIVFILLIGGMYLAYEGVEKIYEFFFPHPPHHKKKQLEKITSEQLLIIEKSKIKSAIQTDFILSIEIVIIAMGTVPEVGLLQQIIVVSIVAIIATIGVYGLVALMVRMDDAGYKLLKKSKDKKGFYIFFGNLLVKLLPIIIKALSIIGTIALLLVAGGIFSHHIDYFHHFLASFPVFLKEFLIGLGAGFVVFIIIESLKKIRKVVSIK